MLLCGILTSESEKEVSILLAEESAPGEGRLLPWQKDIELEILVFATCMQYGRLTHRGT